MSKDDTRECFLGKVVETKVVWDVKMSLLTTERSEVVPFFRAVRVEKRGHEATPMRGEAPHPWSQSVR